MPANSYRVYTDSLKKDPAELGELLLKPGFWDNFPKNPEAFQRAVVKGVGIAVNFTVEPPFGAGLKEEYGGIASAELYKEYHEWITLGPEVFALTHLKKVNAAFALFLPDCKAETDRVRDAYNALIEGLPKPPKDYHWVSSRGGIIFSGPFGPVVGGTLRLWSLSLGYPPRAH